MEGTGLGMGWGSGDGNRPDDIGEDRGREYRGMQLNWWALWDELEN